MTSGLGYNDFFSNTDSIIITLISQSLSNPVIRKYRHYYFPKASQSITNRCLKKISIELKTFFSIFGRITVSHVCHSHLFVLNVSVFFIWLNITLALFDPV